MHHAAQVLYNGKLYAAGKLLIAPDNRSFRYGDGFFETMLISNGKVRLWDDHLERLFASLELLQFDKPVHFTPAYLEEQVMRLVRKNGHAAHGRVRLMIFRGNGGLYDPENHYPNHIIQTWPLDSAVQLNQNGLVIDVFKQARKACDAYSHIKSNNYLPYLMAALWAKKNRLNDAVVLNSFDRVADATIANIFVVQDGIIKTPALSEGCVAGVMRKHLLRLVRQENMQVMETGITTTDLIQASEIFFSNSIYGIKWVQRCGETVYRCEVAEMLYKKLMAGNATI